MPARGPTYLIILVTLGGHVFLPSLSILILVLKYIFYVCKLNHSFLAPTPIVRLLSNLKA
jgi:hypothetical protein